MQSVRCAVFIIGPPGSGKSTIANFLREELDLKKISAGDILRKLANTNNGVDSEGAQKSIKSGVGADDDLIIKIYRDNIATRKRGLVFDGNPGGKSQALRTIDLLRENSINTIICIKLKCPKKVSLGRIMSRTNRDDNTTQIITQRFLWYNTMVKEGYLTMKREARFNIVIDVNRPLSLVKSDIMSFFKKNLH